MRSRRAAFACLLTVLVGACTNGGPGPDFPTRSPAASPTSSNTFVIGLVGTMSGDDEWRGLDAFEGAHLAVHILNRDRTEGEPGYELVTRDDGGDVESATEAVVELASQPQTIGIVYAGPPEGLPPTEEVLADAQVPALICYGDLYGARLLSHHIFQMSPSYLWEARRIVAYALGDRRYQRVGAITSRSLTGQTARQALTSALSESGRRLIASEIYPQDGTRVEALLKRLRRERVQAIAVDASPPEMADTVRALRAMGATYRTTRTARSPRRPSRGAPLPWRPQLMAFDPGLARTPLSYPEGTIGADTYGRGAHYLPVPSLRDFRRSFLAWWDELPLGWEQRAYDAVRLIGLANAEMQGPEGAADPIEVLERIRGRRFAGLDITFGPDDHTAVEQTTVGLWTVPDSVSTDVERELPEDMPWVPLARGFSIDGERTQVLPEDWRFLFRNAPRPNRPAPRIGTQRFGVDTPRRDPVH